MSNATPSGSVLTGPARRIRCSNLPLNRRGLRRVEGELGTVFAGHARLTHGEIAANVEELEDNTGQIAEFASLLDELDKNNVKIRASSARPRFAARTDRGGGARRRH